MKTIVMVDVNLEATCGGLDSIIALARDPAIKAISLDLDNAITKQTEAEIDWGPNPPFKDTDDPRYLPELLKKAAIVDASAMRDLKASLMKLKADERTTFRFHTLTCDHCTPCGKSCHTIDGRVAVDNGTDRTLPLVYSTTSEGKLVSFTVHISCRYITR